MLWVTFARVGTGRMTSAARAKMKDENYIAPPGACAVRSRRLGLKNRGRNCETERPARLFHDAEGYSLRIMVNAEEATAWCL